MHRPDRRFFFEEVTKQALGRAMYRTLFAHPAEKPSAEMSLSANLRGEEWLSATTLSSASSATSSLGLAGAKAFERSKEKIYATERK